MSQPEQPQADAQHAVAMEQYRRDVSEIVDLGRTEFGSQNFDDVSRVVADKFGPRSQEFLGVARQFDAPHRLIAELGEDPERLERLAKMPTARLITEFARMESRSAPHGHASTGDSPAWKHPSSRGRVSDVDWKSGYGSHLSDEAWNKEFDRRQTERRRR